MVGPAQNRRLCNSGSLPRCLPAAFSNAFGRVGDVGNGRAKVDEHGCALRQANYAGVKVRFTK